MLINCAALSTLYKRLLNKHLYNGFEMETYEISKTEMKKLMKEAMISALIERRDLLEEAVSDAILDMKLGLAIEEGDTGEYVSESEIFSKLMG